MLTTINKINKPTRVRSWDAANATQLNYRLVNVKQV